MSRPVACAELFFFSPAVSVSSVVALKTPNSTLSVDAWLFWHFHSPSGSDVCCRVFNVCT